MGTLAQQILRKYNGLEQRPEIKSVVDAVQAKVVGKEAPAPEKEEKPKDIEAKKDDRDLGDSSADGKAHADQPEKK